ncbi:hypothetical protein AVEN_135032-1 [Araneus ventricosus]|uniref:Gustatory receptor n=1 Tax=Araneus ventricosus TaxID=182803 RepID=A0A4Y2PPB6_ARAVE|nr:hypothetical protein AVEN_135032-1 [Araneus ventricosus]
MFGSCRKRALHKQLCLILSHSITVSLGIWVIATILLKETLNPKLIGTFIVCMLTAIHRFTLCCYSSRLGLVAKRLSKLTIKEDKPFNRQIYLLLCSCIVYSAINIVAPAVRFSRSHREIEYQRQQIHLYSEYPRFFSAFNHFINIYQFFFFSLPVKIFTIYFVSVCHDITSLFEAYKACMTSQSTRDYRSLISNYNYLRDLVNEIDSDISCIVFWAAISNVFNVYFGILGILAVKDVPIEDKARIYSFAVFDTFLFFLMCLWSDRVSSSAASVAREAYLLKGDADTSALRTQYILTANQDVHMTFGGLFPLRKSFVLASFGTIITYSVLIKDKFSY